MKVAENAGLDARSVTPCSLRYPIERSKESFKLKRTLLVLILAGAALMPLAASGQVAPENESGAGDRPQCRLNTRFSPAMLTPASTR